VLSKPNKRKVYQHLTRDTSLLRPVGQLAKLSPQQQQEALSQPPMQPGSSG
jgi:hypothetical protein